MDYQRTGHPSGYACILTGRAGRRSKFPVSENPVSQALSGLSGNPSEFPVSNAGSLRLFPQRIFSFAGCLGPDKYMHYETILESAGGMTDLLRFGWPRGAKDEEEA